MNENRVAIVTGAGSGIGRATTELLVRQGAKVVAVDLSTASLAWAEGNDDIVPLPGSVTDVATNEAMVATALEAFGRLDAVALNAGVLAQGGIADGTMEDYDRAMDVNVRGVVLGMKAAIPAMEKNPPAEDGSPVGGSLVVTASVSGLGGDSGIFAYNVAKGAAVNLVRAAALDVAHLNIRVNAVCPAGTRTGMTEFMRNQPIEESMMARIPLSRLGRPEEIANVIAFLASPLSSFMTGAAVPVDGGVTAGTGQWATYGGRKRGFH